MNKRAVILTVMGLVLLSMLAAAPGQAQQAASPKPGAQATQAAPPAPLSRTRPRKKRPLILGWRPTSTAIPW